MIENNAGKLIASMTAQYGAAAAKISSFFGNGRISIDGYSIGTTLTWYGDNGVYVDGQAQATKYMANLNSALVGTVGHDNDGSGYAASIEVGKRIGIGQGWWFVPQAQLSYSKVDFSDFIDPFGAAVSLNRADSLLGRAGLALNHQKAWLGTDGQMVQSNVYGIANLQNEFLDGPLVDVSGTSFASDDDRLWGSVGVGGSYRWNGGRYALYGELTYATSLDNLGDSDSYRAEGGFHMIW